MKLIIIMLFFLCATSFAQEIILAETFEEGIPSGWEVASNQDQRNWYAKSYQGTSYLSMSAFAGRGKPGYKVTAALHSPVLTLEDKQCKLRFSFADAYSNGQPLQVYITNKNFDLIKKIDAVYWTALVNNPGKYDNIYEATDWIPLPNLNKPYRISLIYESQQKDDIVTTIIQLNELDVWCQE